MAGDQVRIRTPEVKRWSEPATVVSDAGTPRSCIVKTPRETLRRNRKHLQLIPSQQTNQAQKQRQFPALEAECEQTTTEQETQPSTPTKSNQQLLYILGQEGKLELPRDLTFN